MASKRRRCETSPQPPVFRFSLDVRFKTESEKEAFRRRRKRLKAGGAQEVVINFELCAVNYNLVY